MSEAKEEIRLYAAGSLEPALHAIADAFEKNVPCTRVERHFGPSGLLRARIEGGERAHLFASASGEHALALQKQSLGGPVMRFARNRLCALLREGLEFDRENLLDGLLEPNIRVGTSTPNADPCGDYTWQLFRLADSRKPGAFAELDRKALKLTGFSTVPSSPHGSSPYGWILKNGKADVFLTYRTNAVRAQQEYPELRIVEFPAALKVSADYCVITLRGAPFAAALFSEYFFSPSAQSVLAAFGFESCPNSCDD